MCGVWRRESARVSRLSERPAVALSRRAVVCSYGLRGDWTTDSEREGLPCVACQRVGRKRAAVAAGAPYAGWAAPPKGFGAMPPMDIAPMAACSTAEKPKASC